MAAEDYEPYLLKDLQDLDYAVGYLAAALEEGEDVFLLAVRNVAKAQGGMKALSDAAQLNRESLYDMLSKKGNPLFSSITSVLNHLGIEITFKRKQRGTAA
jgi:probable addiction module antidote protein